MTYRGFHARFTVPLLLALSIVSMWWSLPAFVWLMLLALNVIVVAFTFPWDAWAVRRAVWEFPADRVWFRIGVLPVEEVAFFVIQTSIVGLLTSLLLRVYPGPVETGVDLSTTALAIAGAALIFATALHMLTRRYRAQRSTLTYAWHLLIWFMPIIVAQWAIGHGLFLPRIGVILASAGSVGLYLIFADLVAIQHGIWFFDKRQITGVTFAKVLPWEEAAFFVITSLLVAQSIVLFLPAGSR